jgi:NAD(P)-dependent dehydrogenase (short-subunit alcohol dehydrogenase family)
MNEIILITGANAGLGKDSARQLAMLEQTKKIILACRNESKAIIAKSELEEITGRNIFEILIMDVSNPESVRNAVKNIKEPIDALIMNAGGMAGKQPLAKTSDGVTSIYAVNLLGHSVLMKEMLEKNLLKNVALYAGSEAARGVKKMGIKQPKLKTYSSDEFASVFDGTYWNGKGDDMEAYALIKLAAAMWMSTMAKEYPNIKFITMSPGATQGTEVMNDIPAAMKIMYKYIMMPIILPLMGMAHSLETGAKRYVDGISDSKFKSGHFYASKAGVTAGSVLDQNDIYPDFNNTEYQSNASEAISRFIN